MTLSLMQVWRLVKRTGARWGRPRPVVACLWQVRRRQRRIAQLRALSASATANGVVVYVDEVDIHLNPKIGPEWMLPGFQRLVMMPGKNEEHYFAGACEPRTHRLVCAEGEGKAS